jgi:Zn-dependent M28 family amino/carboxypeptidase
MLSSNYNKKYKVLLESGAKAIFVIPGKNDSLFAEFLNLHKCTIEESAVGMSFRSIPEYNVFFIPPSLGIQFLNISEAKFSSFANKKNSLSGKDLKGIKPEKIKLKAFQKIEPVETENVLGFIEGTDKKDEVVIVTAHYDHEGIKCGEIYNGADDDGTGTVTILELAQAFSFAREEGNGPRRSILLMTVTGEEKGLLGSKYYVNNPVFPISQTVVDLNIDMIGRIDKYHRDENYVYLIGSNRLSSQLHQVSEDVNFKYLGLELDYKYNAPNDPNQFYYRSDHYSFAKKGVPAIFYFSGTHADYHKPTDDIEKIIFSKVEKTARLIFHTAWELANMEERIRVDVR